MSRTPEPAGPQLERQDERPTEATIASVGWSDSRLLRRLFQDARGFVPHMVGVFFLSLLAAPLALLTPVPVKISIDSVLGDHDLPFFLQRIVPDGLETSKDSLLALAAALLITITFFQYLRGLGESVLATYTSESLVLRFRARLLQHVQKLSLRFHDAKGTAESLYRIQYDATTFEGVIIQGLIPITTAVVTLFAMIGVTAQIDGTLTLIALAACPVLYLVTKYFRHRLRTRWSDAKAMESRVLGVVQEVLSSLRVVKAFGRESWEVQRFKQRARQGLQAKLVAVTSEGVFSLLIGVTVAAGTAAVLYVGVRHVQAGSLTLGNLVLVMLYLVMLYQPLETIGVKFALLQSALASADRAFSLMAIDPDVPDRPDARPLATTRGSILFRDVSFSYDNDQPVLQNVTFEIPPGTRVGICGPTGAGKTTLANLLPRFYDPTSGAILLDDVDLRKYRLADLRHQFSIVLQDTVLFSTSVAENIAYGRPDASQNEIAEAAEAANAHGFILDLPDGYQTQVGERGMRLSGGERQRIALARAFLRDAPVLILDEPTSSIDVKTEGMVMDALERLMQGRTTFMISHRPNTLDACDLLLHVEQGRVLMLPRSGR